ncbi:MAG: acyltransferase [Proteobacteria bacterium]|nr:acyltransferase [Pseudomonadota bacterium]
MNNSLSNKRLTHNNFDFLRLLFAGTVCLVHAYVLSGYQRLAWISEILSASAAVKGFFVISGFLIFMSYERSSSVLTYMSKRVRRVYPAYLTIVLLCALGLALVSTVNIRSYFSLPWVKYIFSNLVFLNFIHPMLPGLFEANKFNAVNGSLWTLKIEVMFYLMVPIFVYLFRKFGRLPILVFFYFFSIGYAWLFSNIAVHTGSKFYLELSRQLPGYFSYFMSGAFFYYYSSCFENNIKYFLPVSIVFVVANLFYPLPLFEPFSFGCLIVFFGLFFYLGDFSKYGDFSYGLYIVHFPIIQLILQSGWAAHRPLIFLSSVMSLSFIGSVIMWHLIEKRFLLRNSHYKLK